MPFLDGKWSSLELWGYGLLQNSVQKVGNGVIASLTSIGIDPDHFNLTNGIWHTLTMLGVVSLVSAVIGAASYISEHKLPDPPSEG